MQAMHGDVVVADSDHTVVVEGNHYFPEESVHWQHLERSRLFSICWWKGRASYYHLTVAGGRVSNAAWQYRKPLPWARFVRNRVAFGGGVAVVPSGSSARSSE